MTETTDIAVIKVLIQGQAETAKRIEENLKEWRQENRDQITALRQETEKELDTQRDNNKANFAALEVALKTKVDHADLQANQDKSDERWTEVKAMIETKADKRSELIVYGFIAMILMAFAGLVISDYVNKPAPVPIVQHVPAPPVPAQTVTVERPS